MNSPIVYGIGMCLSLGLANMALSRNAKDEGDEVKANKYLKGEWFAYGMAMGIFVGAYSSVKYRYL